MRGPQKSSVLPSWPREWNHSAKDARLQDKLLLLGVGRRVKERIEVGGRLEN